MPRPEGVHRETFQRNLKSLFSFVPVTRWFAGILHRVPCCKRSKAMEEKIKILYIKCTQRNYPLSFKFAVVCEVESGAITNNGAMRKYGIQGHGTINECRRKFGSPEKRWG